MPLALARIALHSVTLAGIALGVSFGPPHITVRPVTDSSAAATGAVLLIEPRHHLATADLTLTARAEGLVDGERVSLPLRVTRLTVGQFSLSRQWQNGTPWLLVLAAEEGPNGAHGVAEALVRIDASGAVATIDYPEAGWIGKNYTPKRTAPADIDALVAGMVAHR